MYYLTYITDSLVTNKLISPPETPTAESGRRGRTSHHIREVRRGPHVGR